MRLSLLFCLLFCLAAPAVAEDTPLKSLVTGDDSRGWDAVGRLNLGNKGFCTAALIGPKLVLTAGHCLFDKETGVRIAPAEMQFLAGWRNGRAAAYRKVRRAIAHPDFVYSGEDKITRAAYDVALIELDQPIRLPSIVPFETDTLPQKGDEVGVVSYAQGREDAASLQEVCHVLRRDVGVLVLNCNVDFGSSGSPIFSIRDGVARVVSVVSAKADIEGTQVALGTSLDTPLADLRAEMEQDDGVFQRVKPLSATLSDGQGGGAKFVKP